MKDVLSDTKFTGFEDAKSQKTFSRREDFVADLVDLFYRANKTNEETIKFEDFTSYLIEHEID